MSTTTTEAAATSTVAPATCKQLSGQWCIQCLASDPTYCTLCQGNVAAVNGVCRGTTVGSSFALMQTVYLAFIVILASVLMVIR